MKGEGTKNENDNSANQGLERLKYWEYWSILEKLPYGKVWSKNPRLDGTSQISRQRKVPYDPFKA